MAILIWHTHKLHQTKKLSAVSNKTGILMWISQLVGMWVSVSSLAYCLTDKQ